MALRRALRRSIGGVCGRGSYLTWKAMLGRRRHRVRLDRSPFDRVQVTFDVVGVQCHELVDEVEASAPELGVGVLGVHPEGESYYVHGVAGCGGSDIANVTLVSRDERLADVEYLPGERLAGGLE